MATVRNIVELECSQCAKKYDAAAEQHLCTCGKPLFAIYDLSAVRKLDCLKQSSFKEREKSLWRWREVLPLPEGIEPISLGEGGTPLLRAEKFGGGDVDLWIKDESLNPTQSFKARNPRVC